METQTVLTQLKRCLDNIDRFDQQVNAFITVFSDTALEEAQRADENNAAGGGTGRSSRPHWPAPGPGNPPLPGIRSPRD